MLSAAGLAGSAGAADAKDHCHHKSETRACCLSTCIVSWAQLCFLCGDQAACHSLCLLSLVWVAPLDLSARCTPCACVGISPPAFAWWSLAQLHARSANRRTRLCDVSCAHGGQLPFTRSYVFLDEGDQK